MGQRLDLHNILLNVMDNKMVAFDPPDGCELVYPCITYKLSADAPNFADNKRYSVWKRYEVTLIDTDPDSEYMDKILSLPFCKFVRPFVSDNIYHWVFDIYY